MIAGKLSIGCLKVFQQSLTAQGGVLAFEALRALACTASLQSSSSALLPSTVITTSPPAPWSSIRYFSAQPQHGLNQTFDPSSINLKPIDPYQLAQEEVSIVSERLRSSITTNIPALGRAAEYFFRRGVEGKRLRPTILLLMSSALSKQPPTQEELQVDLRPPSFYPEELRRRQQRIAEIAEMIHVASLLHDDVIDDASTRRGVLSLNASVGNKLAILAGDFLLARASVSLAALRNTQIVELLSEVLEHLVTGEIMQMSAGADQLLDMEHYLRKTYCKTASLMANSCRAVAILTDHSPEVCDLSWSYGRHLGLAFQIVDDILDLSASSTMLGKPALNDLKSGLATAPILLAAQEIPELKPLITRKFKEDGDVAEAIMCLERSQGMRKAKDLAAHHAMTAADMIKQLPEAENEHAWISRQALIATTEKVLTRTK